MERGEIILKGHSIQTMVRVAGTNQVYFKSIDYSNGRRPLLIVTETRDIVVVKIPGGKHFASIGTQESHPAEYIVFAKLDGDRVMEIVSTPVRTSNEVVKQEA
jgi:hypothetical protein